MSRANWFYQFYTVLDFIKGTIMLIALILCLVPFDIWAIQFIILGPSFTYLILCLGINGINIAMYIRAIIMWRRYVRMMKIITSKQQPLNPNVDIVWQVRHPW